MTASGPDHAGGVPEEEHGPDMQARHCTLRDLVLQRATTVVRRMPRAPTPTDALQELKASKRSLSTAEHETGSSLQSPASWADAPHPPRR